MKVLITGAKGLVGRALVEHCSAKGDEVLGYDHQALDIADAGAVESAIIAQRPDAVINCAAWTDVDGCESNPEKRGVSTQKVRKISRAQVSKQTQF